MLIFVTLIYILIVQFFINSVTHERPRGSRTLIDLALLADVSNSLSFLTVPILSLSEHFALCVCKLCCQLYFYIQHWIYESP